MDLNRVIASTREIADRFKHDAESFYDSVDREKGFITTLGRNGHDQQAPLITVSSVILEVPNRTFITQQWKISAMSSRG